MTVERIYANELNENELKYFTNGLGENGIVTNETYYANLGSNLKLKVYFRYENWNTRPATGVEVEIINSNIGIVDHQFFDFTIFWNKVRRDSKNVRWIEMNGWDKAPTDAERKKLVEAIRNFVNFYWEKA